MLKFDSVKKVTTRVKLPSDQSPENWARGLYLDLHRHSEADDDLLFPKDSELPLIAALTYVLIGGFRCWTPSFNGWSPKAL